MKARIKAFVGTIARPRHHRRARRKAVEGPARPVGGMPSPGWQPMSPDVIDRKVEGWGATQSGRGETGRHARFRFWWLRPWGFNSLRPHQPTSLDGQQP